MLNNRAGHSEFVERWLRGRGGLSDKGFKGSVLEELGIELRDAEAAGQTHNDAAIPRFGL